MLLPAHDYAQPGSLDEALALLNASPATSRAIAGGTDLIYNMRGRLEQPELVVSLRRLPELQGVRQLSDGSLRIGAGERLADLLRNEAVQRWSALAGAIRSVASSHVRNMATLGGNLCLQTRCWYTNQSEEWRAGRGPCLKTGSPDCHALPGVEVCVALNNADLAPLLIAMQATATLASAGGRRELPLEDFYTDDGIAHTVLGPGELLLALTIPPPPGPAVYWKHSSRTGLDFSWGTVGASATMADGRPVALRVVLGSLTTRPLLLDAPVRTILEQGLGDDAIAAAQDALRGELGALTNLYTPAAYKRELARILLKRALLRLRES
ncbi:MAG: FAD binding domain-containing protein [Chromatiales bacterium]|nr:FAD binding domain-containing protein [Chromatiales bacterium]